MATRPSTVGPNTARSTLTGPVTDQAQLHGLLAGLRDIGATLRQLRATEPTQPFATRPVLEHPLHTERLNLRPAAVDDANPTWKFRQLDSVNEWLTGSPDDVDAYRGLFKDSARRATTIIVQLGHDPDGPVIGDFKLRREGARAQVGKTDPARGAQAELGWVLDPGYTGHGYATEAARELLHHAFEVLGVRRVVAHCFLDNDGSWLLMELLGMRRELHAVRGESLHRSGEWLDTVGYALLADEWDAGARDAGPRTTQPVPT